MKTIQVRWIRHAGHCWRSRDELISDVLLWTPTYGRAKAGRPARKYIQQRCEDTGCSPEDLPEAMNDREKWRERVRGIRASGTTWWYHYQLSVFTNFTYYTRINLHGIHGQRYVMNTRFLSSMAYQPSWVIKCQLHPWRPVVILFNP